MKKNNTMRHSKSDRRFRRRRRDQPSSFICPLTCSIMQDPVFDRCAHSFERQAIEEWIERGNAYCPISRKELTVDDLSPNCALSEQIARWKWRREDTELRSLGIDLPIERPSQKDDDGDDLEMGSRASSTMESGNLRKPTTTSTAAQSTNTSQDSSTLPDDILFLPQERKMIRHVQHQQELERLRERKRFIMRVAAAVVSINALLMLALFLWVQLQLMGIEEQEKEELSGEVKTSEGIGRT